MAAGMVRAGRSKAGGRRPGPVGGTGAPGDLAGAHRRAQHDLVRGQSEGYVMSWLARLKRENSSPCTPCEALPKLPKAPFDSKDSAPHSAHGEISEGEAAPAWLLHFTDREPLEVHFIPCA